MVDDDYLQKFQGSVDDYLIRHRSILDVLAKFQEASARVNRAFIKAVTECGCICIHAQKQQIPENINFRELKEYMSTNLEGQICENCKEILTKEIGHCIFYLTAICNSVDINLKETINKEYKDISTLGIFHLT